MLPWSTSATWSDATKRHACLEGLSIIGTTLFISYEQHQLLHEQIGIKWLFLQLISAALHVPPGSTWPCTATRAKNCQPCRSAEYYLQVLYYAAHNHHHHHHRHHTARGTVCDLCHHDKYAVQHASAITRCSADWYMVQYTTYSTVTVCIG